jgi:hypothetical protein
VGSLRRLLDDQRRRLVGVVVPDPATTRSVLRPRGIVSPAFQLGTALVSVGGRRVAKAPAPPAGNDQGRRISW